MGILLKPAGTSGISDSPQVAEVAVQLFISNDKPNCSGLILAGSADFKTELSQSDMFDSRLQVSH